jgi:polyphosphate kinase
VVRQEKQGLRGYVHVGTGNYNSRTATLYTDIGLVSARQELVQDVVELFNGLTGFSKQRDYRLLLVAPVSLRRRMEELIRRESEHARAGRPAAIKAKMNSLVDPAIIALLYEASQAGVQIDLVVRGMCSLRPGLNGISETIRVRSVIGRFLEHSRLFWFANDGAAEMFLGSADWMERNLDRRVEAVVPVLDPQVCLRLEWMLQLYLQDNNAAWEMQPDGNYQRAIAGNSEAEAQAELMDAWGSLSEVPG